ncbi:hypothetical protein SAMN05421810_110115 [Amycolatopsis arida]|uniref:DUF3311 domain-containing protein n=1 Tax=Amycolatopsis arida TaxID=587909 RepID=A0A1I5ZT45_9PSEU|nr:hypothetical protein [Amycolatopsis arida]TDX89349.1 hypothetical protein CLV69_110116 [Amycolatopsis arida]SFQ59628.1 hypothetical protein SAMN05421810_110115 [Amycolatopsis arida]
MAVPADRARPREPIRNPWIWLGLAVIVLVGVPWYLPAGTIGPIVLGLPLWTLVAMGSSVVLCGYLTWVLSRRWNLAEDTEEAGQAGEAGDRPAGTD